MSWKTVWITGASSGIGLELARLLDGRVAHVALTARSADKLEALAAQHRNLVSYPADVSNDAALADVVDRIEADAGQIDLAVLNAGAWKLMEVDRFDLDGVRAGVETNILGAMNALAALLPRMIERGSGHIAIVASVAGYRGLPRSLAYGPTKAALINLAETLRIELEPRGITVSLVNPGFIDTPMTRDNPFAMPGLMPAKKAAQCLLRGLERKKFEIVFPRGFVLAMKATKLMPNAVYFWLMRRLVWRRQSRAPASR